MPSTSSERHNLPYWQLQGAAECADPCDITGVLPLGHFDRFRGSTDSIRLRSSAQPRSATTL